MEKLKAVFNHHATSPAHGSGFKFDTTRTNLAPPSSIGWRASLAASRTTRCFFRKRREESQIFISELFAI